MLVTQRLRLDYTPRERWLCRGLRACPLLLFVLLAMLLQGCGDTANVSTMPTPTPTQPAPTATLRLGMPSLPTLPDYHTVVDLSGAINGIDQGAGAFVSTKPYAVGIACIGTGSITVAFAPQGSFTQPCTPAGNVNLNQVGSDSYPPAHEEISVSVMPSGQIAYHVLVEVEN